MIRKLTKVVIMVGTSNCTTTKEGYVYIVFLGGKDWSTRKYSYDQWLFLDKILFSKNYLNFNEYKHPKKKSNESYISISISVFVYVCV